MEKQGTKGATANALKREIEVRVEVSTRAPADAVYDTLADIGTHVRWAGEMQKPRNHLLTVDAPAGPAMVGSEFTSTGVAPEGRYADRSVVTEATRSSVFEFVTEAHLVTKKGKTADLTNVSRYEITPTAGGSRVSSTIRTVRASALPGVLGLLNVGLLAPILRKDSEAMVRRGLENLAAVAEERV
jgi:Polyketide cyclase / dehydrase and lipid transport